MKRIKRITQALCGAALGLVALTGCEGGELYSFTSPDWIQEKVDSIANAEKSKQVMLYDQISPKTLGSTSDAFWGAHLDNDIKLENSDKTYIAYFTNLSTGANNWCNYYVVLRSEDKATEYAVLRADNYGWGTGYSDCSPSTSVTDWSSWLAAMNGAQVTLSVKNQNGKADVTASVIGTNGTTYTQTYTGITVDSDNCYLDFTNEGSSLLFNDGSGTEDHAPASMTLTGVPTTVDVNTPIDSIAAKVTATVQFEGGASKTVSGTDLYFTVAPDLTTTGTKQLVAIYSKTFNGQAASSPVSASASFEATLSISSIEVTTQPTYTTYAVYSSTLFPSTNRTFTFNPTGMVVTATYTSGNKEVIANDQLTFTAVPATAGDQTVTVSTQNGKTATVTINVKNSTPVNATIKQKEIGTADLLTTWTFSADNEKVDAGTTKQFKFNNYGGASQWNNYLVGIRNLNTDLYSVARADNYGSWGWDTSHLAAAAMETNVTDWAAFTDAMKNGVPVTVYVTNVGNGTVDIQIEAKGNDGKTYTQYYTGIGTITDLDDIYAALGVDGSYIKF